MPEFLTWYVYDAWVPSLPNVVPDTPEISIEGEQGVKLSTHVMPAEADAALKIKTDASAVKMARQAR
jgi:hypothetical protein